MSNKEIILLILFILFVGVNLFFNLKNRKQYLMVLRRAKIMGKHILKIEEQRNLICTKIKHAYDMDEGLDRERKFQEIIDFIDKNIFYH